ncbi:alcohol dehydrogenase catalytic domain-containing protein [Arthrobacter sp.]|uniref:alcohol dehydrogenase catalytic domain-containing protein n=1 Tax=Arthrobacter sp. TaxID=1667 RepID=UPI00289EC297|nr:alcohol dehydrogenase catalytic domain-containing protein [Arthrobacter sp.]
MTATQTGSTTVTSRSLLFDGAGSIPYIKEISVRTPRAGEVLVKMAAAGVCHSDLHVINGDWPFPYRLTLGHEGAGIVESVGAGVHDLEPGDQVVFSWFAPCMNCPSCHEGKSWLCQASGAFVNGLPDGSTPLTADDGKEVRPHLGVGAFSEYSLVPRPAAIKIPSDVPPEVAALIGCSIATGIGAVTNTADVRAGQTAVVVGCGGVGQALIMGLKLVGARQIIAVDLSENRLEIARSFGATDVLKGDDPDLAKKIKEISGGGTDFAFDAIGLTSTSAALTGYLKQGGAAVYVGMPARDAEAVIRPWEIIAAGQRILGCNYGSTRPAVDFPKIADLYLAGLLPLDEMVGERIGLDSAAAAIAGLKSSSGRRSVVVY